MLYLTTWTLSTGPKGESFAPTGVVPGVDWHAVDMRPDVAVVDGFALVESVAPPTGSISLGRKPGAAVQAGARSNVNAALGRSYDAPTLGGLLGQMALDHMTLRAERDGMMRLVLAGKVWWEAFIPPIRGGAIYADNFNRANENGIGFPWSKQPTSRDLDLVSNRIDVVDDDNDAMYTNDNARAAGVSEAQYSQANHASGAIVANAGAGVIVRGKDADPSQEDNVRWVMNSDGEYDLRRFNAGGSTVLASGTTTYVADALLYLSISLGELIVGKYDGNVLVQQTDGSPLSGGVPGITSSSGGGGDTTNLPDNLNNWEGGDLALDQPTHIRKGYRRRILKRAG